MRCPTAPSLPWVAWASLPHLRRDDAPRRLPPPHLGALRLSRASRYLACFPRSWSPLRPRYPRLRTAPDGEARGCAPDRLARRSSGGMGAVPARTPWETPTNFMSFHPIPRFWAYLGATSAWLGAGLAVDHN